MTKGELRKARKDARAAGVPLTGDLALPGQFPERVKAMQRETRRRYPNRRFASRDEQQARYLDCGPGAWDDRD